MALNQVNLRISCVLSLSDETRYQRPGMSISATADRFDEYTMWVDLTDGRTLGVPLAWFPRLLRAPPDARQRVEISRTGLHWEDLDEDTSIADRGDITTLPEHAA